MRMRLPALLSSISTQLRVGLVLLVSLAVVATSGLVIVLSLRAQTHSQLDLQQERSRSAAAQIDNFFDDLLRRLGFLGRLRGLTELPADTQQVLLEGLLRTNRAFSGVMLLDRNGRVLRSVWQRDAEDLGDLTRKPAFVDPVRHGQEYVGEVERSAQLGVSALTIALPVRDHEDRIDGVVLARINLRFLWYFLSTVQVGETGYAYIVDQRLFLIAKKGDLASEARAIDLSREPFMKEVESPDPAIYTGLTGAKVFGASARIPSVRWTIAVELPAREAQEPVRKLASAMGAALAVSTVLAILLGYLYARRVVVPLQRLTKAADAVSAGDLSARAPRLGQNELGALGDAFNEMTARLENNVEELEHALEEARKARREAELALSVRDRFLLIASHELRTPLTPLTLEIQIAQRIAKSHEAAVPGLSRSLDDAARSVLRLRRLAEELLDLLSMLGGELVLEGEELDVCALVREVCARFAAKETAVEITCDGVITGNFDRRRLEQLVSCLIDNAIKFANHKPVELRVIASPERVRLEVEDHGLGIAEASLPHVFDLYARGVSEQEYGGFGVGLYVAKRIAEASGGTIGVVSKVGAGSTFTVELPLRRAKPTAV